MLCSGCPRLYLAYSAGPERSRPPSLVEHHTLQWPLTSGRRSLHGVAQLSDALAAVEIRHLSCITVRLPCAHACPLQRVFCGMPALEPVQVCAGNHSSAAAAMVPAAGRVSAPDAARTSFLPNLSSVVLVMQNRLFSLAQWAMCCLLSCKTRAVSSRVRRMRPPSRCCAAWSS